MQAAGKHLALMVHDNHWKELEPAIARIAIRKVRETGARPCVEVPLAKTWRIYRDAVKRVSGLARTDRGPSMPSHPGKEEIQGVTKIHGEKVFVLRMIQGRNPDWVQRPFFAKYDENATWLNHLQPALGEDRFFFEEGLAAIAP